ncbi:MAG: ClbS/DfsB family four-helix bundle protein [Chloroflexi bacterium]|nr:MAG: ClbS/DfsB family four-helix bundle protein [Chloroflexota bacterium]
MTNSTASKPQLLQEIREAHTQLEQTLSQYDDKQMTELRDEAGWSIKDHLDHLAVWQEGVATLLERRPRYARFEAMGVDVATVEASTEDELNAIIRERTARPTLADTRIFLRQSHEHLLRALSGLSEDALLRGYSYFQRPADYRLGHRQQQRSLSRTLALDSSHCRLAGLKCNETGSDLCHLATNETAAALRWTTRPFTRLALTRARYTPGSDRSLIRARAPCLFFRRRVTCLKMPKRPRHTSTCRNTATPTRAS